MKNRNNIVISGLGLFILGLMLAALAGAETIPYYTGTILPTPQEAGYEDSFLPLNKAGLLLGPGVKTQDPRVKLLRERIESMGGRLEAAGNGTAGYSCIMELRIGEGGLPEGVTLPRTPEGYAIWPIKRSGTDGIVLAGRDATGLLWAVISAGQVMRNDKGKAEMRRMKVRDYPAVKRRGFYPGIWRGTTARDWAWYGMQFKFNVFVFNYLVSALPGPGASALNGRKRSALSMPGGFRGPWPEGWTNDLQAVGEMLSGLGLEWYLACLPVHCALVKGQWTEKVRSGDEADIGALVRMGEAAAKAGGNLYLRYDDVRFPISPADQARFGTAREADVYLLNRIYSAVRSNYPSFKLLFCPPFYWGPKYDPSDSFGESRKDYLAALGERLPKDVGIYWTGNSCWGFEKTKQDVDWITRSIQRKPWIWQNALDSKHVFYYHYGTDPVRCWKEWHYNGFFDDVNVYMIDGYNNAAVTLADYVWNPGAYDAGRSVHEMCAKLFGPDTWPALQTLNEKLSYFDQYSLKITPAVMRKLPEIRKKIGELDTAWQHCLALQPDTLTKWSILESHFQQQKAFGQQVEAYAANATLPGTEGQIQAWASKDAGYKKGRDVLLSAYEWTGGVPAKCFGFGGEARMATWIYGAKARHSRMSADFILANPVTNDWDLVVCGQDDDSPNPCRIRLILNERVVFEGANPLKKGTWSQYTFPVKDTGLHAGNNTFVIENLADSDSETTAPWFLLNYAVLRPSGQ